MKLLQTRFRRLATMLGTAAAVVVLAASPSAAASHYSYQFTYADPYFSASDSNSTFHGQMTFSTNGTLENPMAWSFQLSPAIQAIATGTMTCTAHQTQNGVPTTYYDRHSGIGVGYLWHSRVPVNPFGYTEILSGSCVFPVKGGTATLVMTFDYIASDAGTDVVVNPFSRLAGSTTLTVTR